MKKLKTLIAALMASTMVLTMTGCSEEEPVSATNSGGTTAGSVEMEDEAVTEAAKALTDKLLYPDLKVSKRIKWMAWWPMDETDGAAILFKEVYGIPETGENKEDEGRIFDYYAVGWDERYDKLGAAISSDQSPDLFPFEMADFPYGIVYGRYQPVDDIVDFDNEKWANYKESNELFMFKGQHYTAFAGYSINAYMWYKKSNIEAIGADDPYELFMQGKWDWDAFLDISRKWQQSGTTDEPRYATDGFAVENSFLISTGMPLISFDGTKAISNLYSAEVERALTDKGIVSILEKENLRYPRHELNSYDVNYAAWANDTNLFFCEGTWRYVETLQTFKRKYKWADDEIKVVVFPKDPKADKHYVQLKVDPEMWVKGSQNKEGVQAWYDCKVTAVNDSTLHKAANDKAIRNPKTNYTQEILDYVDLITNYNGDSPVTPVVDFSTSLGPSVSADESDAPLRSLTSRVYLVGDSYVQLRGENEKVINAAIDDLNKQI